MGQIYKTRQTIKEQGRVRHNEKEGDIMRIEKANTRKNKTRRSGGQTRKNGTKQIRTRQSERVGQINKESDKRRKSRRPSKKE